MPLRTLHSAERFVYQRSGPPDGVPLVWLPGVHGCWTPLEPARALFGDAVQLIEVAYPLLDDWSLAHHATALENLLDALGLDAVHLAGESFGSLVAWQFGLSRPERVRSHVLVGGFCQPPRRLLAAGAGLGLSLVWSPAFDSVVDAYVAWRGTRGEARLSPPGVRPDPPVRGARGQSATANRLRLIQRSDFRRHLPDVRFAVRYVGGAADRVVPVGREVSTLAHRLPAACAFESELIERAPHMIIASHPERTVERVRRWVLAIEEERRGQARAVRESPSREDRHGVGERLASAGPVGERPGASG